jgi:SAM-dependent methyltransferase
MYDHLKDHKIKVCCANFYQSDLVRTLLGDVFHPGGLSLTTHLGTALDLKGTDRVLDVACGLGSSAVHLAKHFGCQVIGVDYGAETVSAATARAADHGVAHLTKFPQGDAEGLPFDDGTFDAVILECSFCTFPDKATAAAEVARVLRSSEPLQGHPGGRLGLTDMTVNGPLPGDIESLLGWVACVTGAGAPQAYVAALRDAGFRDFAVEDHRDALLGMVDDVRRKLMGMELAAGLGKMDLGDLDLDEGKRLARRAVELIESGTVGYTLIVARKA